MQKIIWILFAFLFSQAVSATPYWDEQKVPKDTQFRSAKVRSFKTNRLKEVTENSGINVLRIQIDWQKDESYVLKHLIIEPSGTPALLQRSKHKPRFGSYLGVLKDKTGCDVYYDSIGTGKAYRILANAINLRFPVPTEDMTFELYAENLTTGVMEKVLSQPIHLANLPTPSVSNQKVTVKELAQATQSPALRVNIYAEGYSVNDEAEFWQHAMKTVNALQTEKFPGVEHMSFYGVYAPSNQKLGPPKNLGKPVPVYDSFLGLYYAYWGELERWYNVTYPTDENKFRRGLATAPYDYPIILSNDEHYWGVGNYMALTSIPSKHSSFTYLLLHEFAHYFGLNEEYEGGGPTELEFAPDMIEPWSQNITFLVDKNHQHLKWNKFVDSKTTLPTPANDWQANPPHYGAYRGGYADSISTKGKSHKPGMACVMGYTMKFCHICQEAIEKVVTFSLGASDAKENLATK